MNERELAIKKAVRRVRPQRAERDRMIFQAEVTAHAAGPPAVVTLKIQGATETTSGVRYLSSYAPTNGDVVWGVWNGQDPIVLGMLA